MKKILLLLCLCILFSGCRREVTPEEDIKAVLIAHIEQMNSDDPVEAMGSIHEDAPFYEQMYAILEGIKGVYDLNTEIIDFVYIGSRGPDMAVAAVKQSTVKESGPDFRDNIVESLLVFKKDKGEWKIFQSVILSVEYPDQARG